MGRFCPAGHELHCWPILTSGMLSISPQESRKTVKPDILLFFFIRNTFALNCIRGALTLVPMCRGPSLPHDATGHKISKTFAWNDSTRKFSTGILTVDLYRFMEMK